MEFFGIADCYLLTHKKSDRASFYKIRVWYNIDMEKIIKPNANIYSILNYQQVSNDTIYRANHFCFEEKIDGKYILYNNMTKCMLAMDNVEYNDYTTFLNLKHKEAQSKYINKSIIEQLIKLWFIVPDNFDEVKVFDQLKDIYLEIHNANTNKNFNNYTILPTTNCNARCYYCFEIGTKKINMDDKTAESVAQYIINNYKNNKKSVRISWFGGEPLIAKSTIDIICKKLNEANVEYVSSFISNGFLLDNNLIEHAIKNWNFIQIQITLDGTEKIYNKTKSYVGISSESKISPFIKVIDNIENLVNHNIYVSVRLNVSDKNYADLKKLIHFMSERFAEIKHKKDNNQKKYLIVYTHSIFQEIEKAYAKKDSNNNNIEQCYQREIELENLLEENSLDNTNSVDTRISLNFCMADSANCAVIYPNGDLGVCEHYCTAEDSYGTIYNTNTFKQDKLKKWKEKFPIQKSCKTCYAYPSCIRLKHCPNAKKECVKAEQYFNIHKLRKQIRNTYFKWLSKKRN